MVLSKLFLVRHGQIQSDDLGRYWGQTDIPLNGNGLAQAEKLRDRLELETLQTIYSSALKRALRTADIIASPHQVVATTCCELNEIHFGQCEGMTFAEIQGFYPEVAKRLLGSDPELEFLGGESLRTLASRVSRFVAKLTNGGLADKALVVAHGGSLRMLICQLLGMDSSCWWQIRLDLASLTIIDVHPDGAVLRLLNDVCHLGPIRSQSQRMDRNGGLCTETLRP